MFDRVNNYVSEDYFWMKNTYGKGNQGIKWKIACLKNSEYVQQNIPLVRSENPVKHLEPFTKIVCGF